MRRWGYTVSLSVLLVGAFDASSWARQLTFDERVQAQQALERVDHRHRVGETRPFEEAAPRSVIEGKVRDYLRRSVALEEYWHTPVTATMLARETERIARSSRMPARLREMWAALGDDAFLVQECLVRPLLVERLTRSFFAKAERIHGDTPPEAGATSWDDWWRENAARFDSRQTHAVAAADSVLPSLDGSSTSGATCLADDTWSGPFNDVPDPRAGATAVWTGSEVLIWGGETGADYPPGGHYFAGSRYDPATDTWTAMTTANAPEKRYLHTAVWTGREMIVWGGNAGSGQAGSPGEFDSGGRYDPVSDSWTPTSEVNAPHGQTSHVAVWTGSEMIISGSTGNGLVVHSGRYNPRTDTWHPMTTVNQPYPVHHYTAVWTGTEMIVWAGKTSVVNFGGKRYDPVTDTWTTMTTVNAPKPRWRHNAVWTGTRMVIWGGVGADGLVMDVGGSYDPVTDTWSAISSAGAPAARSDHSGVWTGTHMLVWGGSNGSSTLDTGGRYEPATDTWTPISTLDAPEARVQHAAVWAGESMVVWGGSNADLIWGAGHAQRPALDTGGRYDPATDTWTPTALEDVPPGHSFHSAVWTGSEMLVWGGWGGFFDNAFDQLLAKGYAYDPALDSWSTLSEIDVPAPRHSHTAVWTGNKMVIWGGYDTRYVLNTGGQYDPVANSWAPTSVMNAPSARNGHTAVWTGERMIVWGGYDTATGGLYDPVADSWNPTSLVGAPSQTGGHSAVWTGSRMIVWGGNDSATGGSYDPATDSWLPITTLNATERSSHSAVWTGSKMLVWGGVHGDEPVATGGVYDPVSDAWTPTSLVAAPSPRAFHGAVWTGSRMVVWGGYSWDPYNLPFDTGASYDPTTNTWTPTSTTGVAPSARVGHSAVWANGQMIVWGGINFAGESLSSWGLYALGHGDDDDGDGLAECAGDCDDLDGAVGPRAVELCDGRDNDCDFVVDESAPPPPEVVGLEFTSSTALSWDPAPFAISLVHQVARGSLAELPVGTGASEICLSSVAGTTATDDDSLATGAGFWYLVRARNACGTGTYGAQSDGTEHRADACP